MEVTKKYIKTTQEEFFQSLVAKMIGWTILTLLPTGYGCLLYYGENTIIRSVWSQLTIAVIAAQKPNL